MIPHGAAGITVAGLSGFTAGVVLVSAAGYAFRGQIRLWLRRRTH